MKHIFFVEDDLSLINGLSFALKRQGYDLDIARTKAEAERLWGHGNYDLVILDVSLPDGSGFDLCKKIRKTSKVPIMFLTAADEETDIIMGLDIGGDDYIQKPYSLGVLLAKVKAVLKRFGQAVQTNYSDGYLTLNTQSKEVCVNGVPTKLTALEFRLLLYLIENKGKVISKRELFEKVWEDKFTGDGTLNVHIRRLREAIEQNPNEPKYIVTVWGDGYKFTGENQ